jgi:cell division protein FtsB
LQQLHGSPDYGLAMQSGQLRLGTIGIDMTSSDLLDDNKLVVPVEEYQELINLRKEVEKLKRENYGLKTTIKNLRETIEKQYGYHTFAN